MTRRSGAAQTLLSKISFPYELRKPLTPRFADPLPPGEGVETQCRQDTKSTCFVRSFFIELLLDCVLSPAGEGGAKRRVRGSLSARNSSPGSAGIASRRGLRTLAPLPLAR